MLNFLKNADFKIKNYDIQLNLQKQDELVSKNSDIAIVSIVQGSIQYSHFQKNLAEKLLNMNELHKYKSFGSEKRKYHYIMGRIAAKNAFMQLTMQLTKEQNPQEICITNTQEGYPVIESDMDYTVSISHSGNYAAAIVFRKNTSFFRNDMSCGIDLEYINSEKIRALKKISLQNEPIEHNVNSLTIAWCLKESLGKALLCGLNNDPETFRIKRYFQKNDKCTYQAEYTHHQQYIGIAKIINTDTENNIVCAITHNLK